MIRWPVAPTRRPAGWLAINSHKTQGLGFVPQAHTFYYYYELLHTELGSPSEETNWYTDLDPTLTGLADYPGGDVPNLRERLADVVALGRQAALDYPVGEFARAGKTLLEARDMLRALRLETTNPNAEALQRALDIKIARFESVAAACLGLRLETNADDGRIVPGQRFTVNTRLWNGLVLALDTQEAFLEMPENWQATPAKQDDGSMEYAVTASPDAQLTTPYWLQESATRFTYQWSQSPFVGQPFEPAVIYAACRLRYEGHEFTLRTPVRERSAFPGGYRELPIAVLPPISLHPDRDQVFLPANGGRQQIHVRIVAQNNTTDAEIRAMLHVATPDGWTVSPAQVQLVLHGENDTQAETFTITIPDGAPAGKTQLTT